MYVTNSTNHMKVENVSLFCAKENATLTTVNSNAERDFLYDLISHSTYYPSIASYKVLIDVQNDKWVDSNILLYTDCETKYPSSSECTAIRVESNGIMAKIGKWTRMNCDESVFAFLCKTKANKLPVLHRQCLKGYVYRPRTGLCYAIKSPKTNTTAYETAAISCQDELGMLVSVHSTEETEFITRELVPQRSNVTRIYLALIYNFDKNGGYSWADGTIFDYQNWNPTKARQNAENSCVEMDPKTGFWDQIPCIRKSKHDNTHTADNAGIICQTLPIFH
ncbi:hypothetical protein LOAG_10937 [Loa loa]|uniref:C-type lectin domain-containing protein n=1 Tax=Loa loa TaxID=7209 RepID=A0A1I7VJH6_LOALO|nr:hypothetical protein LOAG_10937 [Loa loa]EFO17563.2 hypothetical protein LOAG_10937 [Loa loa]